MWKTCDDFCFKAKNLYNTTNFIIKQALLWKRTGKYEHKEAIIEYADLVSPSGSIGKFKLSKRLQDLNHPDYRALPSQTSQQVIADVFGEYKATFAAIKSKNVKKVNFPRYKHKEKGRYTCTFTNQNTKVINDEIYYKYPQKKSLPKLGFFGLKVQHSDYQTVSIVPNIDGTFHLIVAYRKEVDAKKCNGNNTLSVDLGVNTLMAVSSDKGNYRPVLVNGKPLKSLNRYWQLLRAEAQSKLPHGQHTSEYIRSLDRKRNNKMNDAMHKASRWLIEHAIENNAGRIIIGYNKNQKQRVHKLGKKSRTDFVQLPRYRLVKMIQYKAEEVGIEVIIQQEAYTSLCSALDRETICKHDTYCGERDAKNKGKFTTANGTQIHADVNASLNIMRMVIGDDFLNLLDIGCVLQPKRVNVLNGCLNRTRL